MTKTTLDIDITIRNTTNEPEDQWHGIQEIRENQRQKNKGREKNPTKQKGKRKNNQKNKTMDGI